MAISRLKTWIAGEVLSASDLNGEFNNIVNNGEDLGWPATKSKDLDGQSLLLDSDADSHFTADTDDRLDLALAGVDLFRWDGTVATPVNGIDFIARATGSPASIQAQGSDSNVALDLRDDNGNELLIFSAVASAVNQIQIENAVTNEHPEIQATGGDTNINIDFIPKGSGVMQSAGLAVGLAGKQTIWVPAAAMRPTVSNGCSALTLVETTAGRPDMQVLDFITSADEHAQFQVAFPKSWNLGTITFQAFWTSTAADTDGVTWGLQGMAVTDNTTIDAAYGTAITVDDANQSAAEELLVAAESGAVTIDGTPADDDLCFFRVFRDVSDGNDTAAEDARLLGIKFFLTTDTGNDV